MIKIDETYLTEILTRLVQIDSAYENDPQVKLK